jgi:hypothetical protein
MFDFPHVRFVSHTSPEEKNLCYLGGELNTDLIVGKRYHLVKCLYAESINDKRKTVWTCKVNNKILIISINNFGSIEKLRDIKLNQILK